MFFHKFFIITVRIVETSMPTVVAGRIAMDYDDDSDDDIVNGSLALGVAYFLSFSSIHVT